MARNPWQLVVLVLLVWACGTPGAGQAGPETTQTVQDAGPQAPKDAVEGPEVQADVAKVAPPLQAIDRTALEAADRMRQACQSLSPWPGFLLGKWPIYLVFRDEVGDGRRGYLWSDPPPKKGLPVQEAQIGPGWVRIDTHLDGFLGDFEADLQVLDAPGFGVSFRAGEGLSLLADRIARAGFERLRTADPGWLPPPGCAQPKRWSKNLEAVALMLLECEVLQDAVLEQDPAKLKLYLAELRAARVTAIDLDAMVARMYNDHENTQGAAAFASGRLAVQAGLRTEAELWTTYANLVAVPLTAPLDQMTEVMLERAIWSGAVQLELARRLGWEVAETYAEGKALVNVMGQLLGPQPSDLLEKAKARYDWPQLQARAAAMGPP